MKVAWTPATRSLREGLRCACSPRLIALSPFAVFQRRSYARPMGLRKPRERHNQFKKKDEDEGKKKKDEEEEEDPIFYARLVPASRSYFTTQPLFTDDLLRAQELLQKYQHLPLSKPGLRPPVAWQPLIEYKNMVGEEVKASKYRKIVDIFQRLYQIHPAFMPPEVKEAIKDYKRDINPFKQVRTAPTVNDDGRALGAGRRKASTARAWIVEGAGEVIINGKSLAEAFARIHDRESVIWALKITNRMDKYNIFGRASGGGTTGQAEALALAVGRALMAHEPALKPVLRKAGCVTRDPRRVERKKPGHVKARKMPAWVKR